MNTLNKYICYWSVEFQATNLFQNVSKQSKKSNLSHAKNKIWNIKSVALKENNKRKWTDSERVGV